MPPRAPELDEAEASEVLVLIRKEIARLERRLTAIDRDIRREDTAKALQYQAELFVRSRLPGRGVRELQAVDYAQDPPVMVTAAVDPALDPRSQVEAWFKAARRYLRGAELGRMRAAETRTLIEFLSSAHERLEALNGDPEERQALLGDPRIARLRRGPREVPRGSAAAARRPYREFVGQGGSRIWVGRGARDNDELTTRLARPHDWFFHVQGASGAHVIVPRNKGEPLSPEVLLDAAHLAHHFSSLASDNRAEVAYTERRFVQKRRNSPAGTVQLLRLKVLHLVQERDRVERLVAAEVRATG